MRLPVWRRSARVQTSEESRKLRRSDYVALAALLTSLPAGLYSCSQVWSLREETAKAEQQALDAQEQLRIAREQLASAQRVAQSMQGQAEAAAASARSSAEIAAKAGVQADALIVSAGASREIAVTARHQLALAEVQIADARRPRLSLGAPSLNRLDVGQKPVFRQEILNTGGPVIGAHYMMIGSIDDANSPEPSVLTCRQAQTAQKAFDFGNNIGLFSEWTVAMSAENMDAIKAGRKVIRLNGTLCVPLNGEMKPMTFCQVYRGATNDIVNCNRPSALF